MPELSIVIPCLNEARTLGLCLEKASRFLLQHGVDGEIIVADNGSTDDSAAVARQYQARVVHEPVKGYGAAVMAGIRAAGGRYIIMGDADDSYDFSEIMPVLEKLREGYQLVVGNRFKGGIERNAMPFLHRYLGNPVLSFAGRVFFHTPVRDFHCGVRGFSKSAVGLLDLKTTGMEFASEMIVKASLLRLKVCEVPVTLYRDKRDQPSHLNTWRDGWRHLRFLLLYSPRWLFLYPAILLMGLGLFTSASLLAGPVTVDGKRFDIHTLMYTSGFILLGFQFISFYFFSRVYGALHGLIPYPERFIKSFFSWFQLERVLLAGFLLFLTGIALNLKSVLYWQHTGFANLNPVIVLRWVIPSVTLLVLGLQVMLSGFYISILTIKTRETDAKRLNP